MFEDWLTTDESNNLQNNYQRLWGRVGAKILQRRYGPFCNVSTSYSDDVVSYAVGVGYEVGVDIEQVRQPRLNINQQRIIAKWTEDKRYKSSVDFLFWWNSIEACAKLNNQGVLMQLQERIACNCNLVTYGLRDKPGEWRHVYQNKDQSKINYTLALAFKKANIVSAN